MDMIIKFYIQHIGHWPGQSEVSFFKRKHNEIIKVCL